MRTALFARCARGGPLITPCPHVLYPQSARTWTQRANALILLSLGSTQAACAGLTAGWRRPSRPRARRRPRPRRARTRARRRRRRTRRLCRLGRSLPGTAARSGRLARPSGSRSALSGGSSCASFSSCSGAGSLSLSRKLARLIRFNAARAGAERAGSTFSHTILQEEERWRQDAHVLSPGRIRRDRVSGLRDRARLSAITRRLPAPACF